MLRFENVATPATAATVVVPESVPPPAFVPIAATTFAVYAVAMLLLASRALTTTDGAMDTPAVALVGCVTNARCVARPGVMLKPVLVALVRAPAVAVSVYPVPVLSMLNVENVATPATAAIDVVPESVPPPALFRIAIATEAVKSTAGLLAASSAVTVTVPIVAPATVLPGCSVNTRWVATLLMMLNPPLVALVRDVAVAARV